MGGEVGGEVGVKWGVKWRSLSEGAEMRGMKWGGLK